jgi:hypothetical protein
MFEEGTYLYSENHMLPENLSALIDEMVRNGITHNLEQSEILREIMGVEVPPHLIAEYKCRKKKK